VAVDLAAPEKLDTGAGGAKKSMKKILNFVAKNTYKTRLARRHGRFWESLAKARNEDPK